MGDYRDNLVLVRLTGLQRSVSVELLSALTTQYCGYIPISNLRRRLYYISFNLTAVQWSSRIRSTFSYDWSDDPIFYTRIKCFIYVFIHSNQIFSDYIPTSSWNTNTTESNSSIPLQCPCKIVLLWLYIIDFDSAPVLTHRKNNILSFLKNKNIFNE